MSSELTIDDLTLALASAKVGVWKWLMNDDKVIWSPEVYAILRVDPKTLGGPLTFEQYTSCLHEDDKEMTLQIIEEALAAKGDYSVEHRLRFGDEVRWVRGQGKVLVDDEGKTIGITGAVLDVTETKRAFEGLKEAGERFRLLSELASDYIYTADLASPVLTPAIVAGSFERTTGYTTAEVEALGGWLQVMHPDDVSTIAPLMSELQKGLPVVTEYRIRTKGGAIRWLRDRVQPILTAEGQLVAINGGVQDITERKLLMDQLGHAQKMEALAHLAGNVAHDFNNLLTVMFATSGLLGRQLPDPAAQESLRALDAATERAADLTSALLTFSRRQVGSRRATKVSQLLEGAMPILNRAVGERVSIEVKGSSHSVVAVDPSQMELALLNLVVNARDAMPDGGVITLEYGDQHWDLVDSHRPAELGPGDFARISVSDTGSGISNDTMAHLFEPFFTTKEMGNGTGLGLAAVHGVVRQHQGVIQATSKPGIITTFTIYLPLSSEPERLAIPTPRPWSAVGGTETILVVEDDPLVRAATIRNLREIGYRVLEADSAEAAQALIEEVDLVLSDVRLPNMAGTELALQIAKEWPGKPVILMSGLVEDESQLAVIESGQFAFLPKPFTLEGLSRQLRRSLGNN